MNDYHRYATALRTIERQAHLSKRFVFEVAVPEDQPPVFTVPDDERVSNAQIIVDAMYIDGGNWGDTLTSASLYLHAFYYDEHVIAVVLLTSSMGHFLQ